MSADEKQIRDLMDQLARAWNAQDWPGFSARFTADCQYVSTQGKVLAGPEQISTFLLSAVAQKRAVSLDEMQVRLPAGNTGIVLCRWTLHAEDVTGVPTGLPPRQGIFTATLVNDKHGWRIVALHNSDVQPNYPRE